MDIITTIAMLNNTATDLVTFRTTSRGILGVDERAACIRSYDISSRTLSVLAGACGIPGYADGTLEKARFDHPSDIAVRESDGSIFVADSGNTIVRWIRADQDLVSTLAGTPGKPGMRDGPVGSARFSNSLLLALIDDEGLQQAASQEGAGSRCPTLMVVDKGNLRLRSIMLVDAKCNKSSALSPPSLPPPSTPPHQSPPPALPTPCSSRRNCDCAEVRWSGRVEGAAGTLFLVTLLTMLATVFYRCVCRRRPPSATCNSPSGLSQALISDPCSSEYNSNSTAAQTCMQPHELACSEIQPNQLGFQAYSEIKAVPKDGKSCGKFAPSYSWSELIKHLTPQKIELQEVESVFNEVKSACLNVNGVINVELAGSHAKRTAMRGSSDLDVVVFFSDFDAKSYESHLDKLPPALKDLHFMQGEEAPMKINQDSVHHYTFTLRRIRVDILVGGELPADHPNCLSLKAMPNLSERRAWRPSCTPKAVKFICEQANRQKYFITTVRLAKYWRSKHVDKGKEMGLSSTLLELLVAHALQVSEEMSGQPPQSIPDAFIAFLRFGVEKGPTLRATWGVNLGQPVENQFSLSTNEPLVLAGPHDPTNNVAETVKEKDWWFELSKCAKNTLEWIDAPMLSPASSSLD